MLFYAHGKVTLPYDFPLWHAVDQQARRWMRSHIFLQIAGDLRRLLRELGGKGSKPTAVIPDRRTLRTTLESRPRTG